jgi:hypothetical protein
MPGYSYGAEQFRDLWVATRTKFSTDVIDMLGRSHPLLNKIAGNENVTGKRGETGKRIVETIVARPIDNCKWVSFRAQISSEETSILEQIEWDWKLFMQSFKVYDQELSVNNSDAICNLLVKMQRAAKAGLVRNFNTQLYSAGVTQIGPEITDYQVDPYKMGGLQYLLSENPYKEGLIVLGLKRGGAPGDKYEFWRNRSGQWYRDTWPADNPVKQGEYLYLAIDKMIDILGNSEGNVDGIYTNHKFYDLLKRYMESKLIINNVVAEKRELGFNNIVFKGIPVYLDKSCPENKMFFINSKEIYLNYLEGENVRQRIKESPTELAKIYITTFIGNLTCARVRYQGMLTLHPDKTKSELAAIDMALPEDCNICDFANYHDYDYNVINSEQVGDKGIENVGYSGSGVYREAPIPPVTENK